MSKQKKRKKQAVKHVRARKHADPKNSVPLSEAARRRVSVASRIIEYINANAKTDILSIPSGKLDAKTKSGESSLIEDKEIEAFLNDRAAAGKLFDVKRVEYGYTFRIVRNSPSRVRKISKAKEPEPPATLPDPGETMRAVLAAIADGKTHHAHVRNEAAKTLRFPMSQATAVREGDSFDRRVGLIINHFITKGYVWREGKFFSIRPQGSSRLHDERPFGESERPKRLVRRDMSSSPSRFDESGAVKAASRVLTTIPNLPPEKLLALWSNAIKIISDPSRSREHKVAKSAIDKVEEIWSQFSVDEEMFPWPTTEIGQTRGNSLNTQFREEGMLSYLEYRVGKTAGLSATERQAILARVFEGKLPAVFEPAYMSEWGTPRSAPRLRKMAESLAAFVRNAKRNNEDRLDEARLCCKNREA